MNKTKLFLEDIEGVWKAPTPDSVMKRAKQSLLDYLAVTCAGANFQKKKIKNYCDFIALEGCKHSVIGTSIKTNLKDAVFLNGLNSHALDYDDGTNKGIIHLGSPIFSLLIPLSVDRDILVEDLLKAAIVGYEASYTLATSIQPEHKARGYHATGTCGTIGATVAAAYMLGFNREERFNAVSSACVAASGMLKVLDEGSELKPYNVAKTSLLALTAVQMGKAGFKGPTDPFSGRGFLQMMAGSEKVSLKHVLEDSKYAIMKTYTKPYASCRYTHPAVEAAIYLKDRVDIDSIDEIVVRTYDLAVFGHDHTEINGSYSAKMSIPYSTAVAILYGKAGLQEFCEETIKQKKVKDLTRKVKVIPDKELSKTFPAKQPAIVTVNCKSESIEHIVEYPKGEPENPLTEMEFLERFFGLMDYANVENKASREIVDKILEKKGTVNSITDSLCINDEYI